MTERIRRSAQFRAFASGSRRRRGPFTMIAAPSVDPGTPRVAYAIGRGVGPAVTRNRLRRRLRHAVAEVGQFDKDTAYLVSATKSASKLTYSEIVRLMGELAADLGSAA